MRSTILVKGKRLDALDTYYNKREAEQDKPHWRRLGWRILTVRQNENESWTLYGFLPGGRKAEIAYLLTLGASSRVAGALRTRKRKHSKVHRKSVKKRLAMRKRNQS